MTKSRFLLGVLLGFITLTLITSCSKDEQKNNKLQESQNTEVRTSNKYDNYSIFGNNHQVPMSVAQTIAQKINMAVPADLRKGIGLRSIQNSFTINDSLGNPALYIINFQDDGFVVISADERLDPIQALVEKGKYEAQADPSGLMMWFDVTLDNIDQIRNGTISNSRPAKQEWIKTIKSIDEPALYPPDNCCPECPNYPECIQHPNLGCGEPDIRCFDEDDNGDPCGNTITTIKGPYLATSWGQGCTYNEQCPDENCDACFSNNRAWTGCVATSISQVLKYWAHPETHAYNYASMPNGSGNSEVQRMMRNAGDEVDMDYGCDGSGADSDDVPDAFTDGFDFGSCDRDSYGSGSYLTVISNLNSSKPVILDGCRSRKKWLFGLFYTYSNCHSWVCDGYNKTYNNCYSTLKFHMNWGWDGSFNGWYASNSWSPGSSNYQYAQDYCYNINP